MPDSEATLHSTGSSRVPFVAFVAAVALVAYVTVTWEPSDEITEYTMDCYADLVNGRCNGPAMALNPSTYKIDVASQRVIERTAGILTPCPNCVVWDRKNWSCRLDDGDLMFGFEKGRYWEVRRDEVTKKLSAETFHGRTFHVSKWKYILHENWKYLLE